MRKRRIVPALVVLAALLCVAYAQRYRGMAWPFGNKAEGEAGPLPADAEEKTEWLFARLRYPNWRSNDQNWSVRGAWNIDYPKADRTFVQGVRRLTRLHTRSVEQVIDLDSDDVMNYPWIYAVEVGHWDLTDAQCKKLREYLLKGGFLMTDDNHGTYEWYVFMESMRRVFPDRPPVDLPNSEPIFHVLYDLDDKFQVPGLVNWPFDKTYEYDGYNPTWRGIYDDHGRLMVGICHNMDLGDAWEWADHPAYPEKYASMAYRIGINYVIYAMTH